MIVYGGRKKFFKDYPHASDDFGKEEQMYRLVQRTGAILIWINLVSLSVQLRMTNLVLVTITFFDFAAEGTGVFSMGAC